jgi:hypothetical protein
MLVLLFVILVIVGSVTWPFIEGLMILYEMNLAKSKNDHGEAIYETVETVITILYMMVYQKLWKNLVVVGPGVYDVLYTMNAKLYKIRIYHKRGPRGRKVLQVINEADEDVTTDIVPYLGPMEDFHGMDYKPQCLGHTQLSFNLNNGDTKTFGAEEPMRLL